MMSKNERFPTAAEQHPGVVIPQHYPITASWGDQSGLVVAWRYGESDALTPITAEYGDVPPIDVGEITYTGGDGGRFPITVTSEGPNG